MTTELAARDPELLARLMTEDEAREAVAGIKRSIGSLRAKLVELHEREGWRALGYASIEACCAEEFGWKRSHLFRQLTAGAIERNVGSPIGEQRESHLRPLAGKPPEVQRQAFAEASANGAPTAEKVRQAVERIEQPEPTATVTPASAATNPWVQELVRLAAAKMAGEKPSQTITMGNTPAVTQSEPEQSSKTLAECFDTHPETGPVETCEIDAVAYEGRRASDLGEIEGAVLLRNGISVGKAAGYFAQILAAAEQGGATWEARLKGACRASFK